MIDANLFIDADTQITYNSAGTTHWVRIAQDGSKLAIFTETAEDAKRLTGLLWIIREHLDPKRALEKQAGISAEVLIGSR